MPSTLTAYIDQWAEEIPDTLWLQDRSGDTFTTWTWRQAREEIEAVGAALESLLGEGGRQSVGIVSRNRAHWVLADMAIIASGNVTIPMFTTLADDVAEYVMTFTEMTALIVGEAENWEKIRHLVPSHVKLIALPGVDLQEEHIKYQGMAAEFSGKKTSYQNKHDDLITLVFTSGTTGMPKGVMQTHDSFILPIMRFKEAFDLGDNPQFLSYLPLSHIAERQLVGGCSVIYCGKVNFVENMTTLFRDLVDTQPNFFFGPPRVWEQIQQVIIGQFGSQADLDKALANNREGTGQQVRDLLGMDNARYLLTAAAPTPPALITWFGELGLILMEGFGQTEAMGLIANNHGARKIGSIGRAVTGVEVRISKEGELQVKSDGFSPGYYKQPEKTAETFVDGWVFTGDKAYIDDDGFIYLTGRVKDYFKTIQGKFVAPPAIEAIFSDNQHTEQQCLLGRGYSKTVMVCVLSAIAQELAIEEVEADLLRVVAKVNDEVESHARVGALVISREAWGIDNAMLTPTLKIRRDEVEKVFGERAQELARAGAEQGKVIVHWH
jgi:long-chain acyl-CoA synthetase